MPRPSFVAVAHQLRLSRLEDREHAVLEGAAMKRRQLIGIPPLVLPEGELTAADQIARVRESGDPAAVVGARVPPHVVQVQMRTHDEVDRLGADPDPREAVEVAVAAAMIPFRDQGPCLLLADAGIDEDRQVRCMEHERLTGGTGSHGGFLFSAAGTRR
jgi:hypothetical protein